MKALAVNGRSAGIHLFLFILSESSSAVAVPLRSSAPSAVQSFQPFIDSQGGCSPLRQFSASPRLCGSGSSAVQVFSR